MVISFGKKDMTSKKTNDQGIVVKAYLSSQEIRRFLLEPGVLTNFDYLKQKTHCIFNIPQDEVLTYCWKDADNECIMFSSDEEMLEAINYQSDGVFRLYISRPSVTYCDGNTVVHSNVVCDGCQGEVRGTRYKCVVCPDYDLCSKCENVGKHLEHNMMCVRRPMKPGEWGYWRDIAMQMNPQMPCNPNPTPPPPPPPGRPAYPGYCPTQWGAGYPWQCRKMWKKAFKCHQKLQRENSRIRESAACGSATPLMNECNREKICEETGQPKWADTHKEFLRTMGEAVQSMLDPFGIDVSFSVDGAGEATCTKIKPTDTSTEQEKSPEKNVCDEVVNVDVDVEKLQASDCRKSPQRMNVDLDSAPSSPDAQRTAEFIVIDPDDGEEPPPTCTKFTCTKPLNPKVIHSLELMKRMGFKDNDGWLTKLLIENDGNIDKVLDIFQNKCKG